MGKILIVVAIVLGILATGASAWMSFDASGKAEAATAAATTATQQSNAAMADASEARAIAAQANDKANGAIGVANLALQVANNAGKGEAAAIVAIGGAVLVALGLLGGLFMLIAYGMQNTHAINMARLTAPPIQALPYPAWSYGAAPELPARAVDEGIVDGEVVRRLPAQPPTRALTPLGEPMYLIRKGRGQ